MKKKLEQHQQEQRRVVEKRLGYTPPKPMQEPRVKRNPNADTTRGLADEHYNSQSRPGPQERRDGQNNDWQPGR